MGVHWFWAESQSLGILRLLTSVAFLEMKAVMFAMEEDTCVKTGMDINGRQTKWKEIMHCSVVLQLELCWQTMGLVVSMVKGTAANVFEIILL
jgi:hypothetical protein